MDIELRNLSLTISKNRILNNINADFFHSSITGILGENGSGKSSLLKCIAGLVTHTGSVTFSGVGKRKLGYVPQQPAIPIGMTVAEFILLGRTTHYNWYVGETESDFNRCREAINDVSLTNYSGRYVDTLSGGEMQRAVLARAIAQEANILILDEPTSALDLKGQIEVFSLLLQLQKKFNLTIIIALHDLNVAINFTNYVLFLKKGSLVRAGKTNSIMTSDNLSDLYGVPVEVVSSLEGEKLIVSRYKS